MNTVPGLIETRPAILVIFVELTHSPELIKLRSLVLNSLDNKSYTLSCSNYIQIVQNKNFPNIL